MAGKRAQLPWKRRRPGFCRGMSMFCEKSLPENLVALAKEEVKGKDGRGKKEKDAIPEASKPKERDEQEPMDEKQKVLEPKDHCATCRGHSVLRKCLCRTTPPARAARLNSNHLRLRRRSSRSHLRSRRNPKRPWEIDEWPSFFCLCFQRWFF